MRHIVNGLLSRDGAVLLARRARHRKAYPGLWSFPGGHVEPNEALDEALIRELREEIGVVPTRYVPLGSIPDPNDTATYHMYRVTNWEGGEPVMAGDEHTALAWFAYDEAAALPDLALSEYRPLFRQLT